MPAFVGASDDPTNPAGSLFPITCTRCGRFRLSHFSNAEFIWNGMSPRQIANASGYIRDNQDCVVSTESDVKFLKGLLTPTVAERARKLLRALAEMFPRAGTEIRPQAWGLDRQINHFLGIAESTLPSDPGADEAAIRMFPLLGFAWAENEDELMFLLMDYLCGGVGFLDGENYKLVDGGVEPCQVVISPAGWEHLENAGLADSATGFVAMWFDSSMDTPWQDAFYPAISEAGYSPLRIDKREHNNKIDDEIIASIRGSRFIVADFTGGRGGVYFEAGFAAGLTKPVIWTVREDWLSQLHFDTRQFNHIPWKQDDLPAFRIALKNRIEATLGHGPLTVIQS